jgi:voltage-gated potassium channel
MPLLVLGMIRAMWNLRRDSAFRMLGAVAVVAIGSATAFYWLYEDLRLVDAFYFSVTTIATVGYGDLAPKTDLGKIFTSLYVLVGVGTFAAFLTHVARQMAADGLHGEQQAGPERPEVPDAQDEVALRRRMVR